VCIRREGIEPATGTRYLEELVIEIVHEEPLEALTERAEILTARGMRRVLAIFVGPEDVREWKDGQWVLLDPNGTISDPVLAVPSPFAPCSTAPKPGGSDRKYQRCCLRMLP
jgi:hypothetical protein